MYIVYKASCVYQQKAHDLQWAGSRGVAKHVSWPTKHICDNHGLCQVIHNTVKLMICCAQDVVTYRVRNKEPEMQGQMSGHSMI